MLYGTSLFEIGWVVLDKLKYSENVRRQTKGESLFELSEQVSKKEELDYFLLQQWNFNRNKTIDVDNE